MTDQKTIDEAVKKARLAYRIETAAKIRLVYSEQALQAAESGLSSLSEEYLDLSEKAKSEGEELQHRK